MNKSQLIQLSINRMKTMAAYMLTSAVAVSLFCHPSHAETKSDESCAVVNNDDFTFRNLVEIVRNKNCRAKSIDDVVPLLPERMRSKLTLFFRSQSLQGPHRDDFLHPRAILSSVKSVSQFDRLRPALMVSFNGHPSQPGYNRLEAVDLNPFSISEDVFTYYEIEFPTDEEAKKLTWNEAQLRIKVSEANPKTCQQCHGNPARPIFQAYPLWEGAFGSKHVDGMSDYEKKGLRQFVDFHSTKQDSRYRHLNPSRFQSSRMQTTDFNLRLPRLTDPIDFDSSEPAIQLNTDLANYNGLRVTRLMNAMPFYQQFKFAIAGALQDCDNFVEFFTQDAYIKLRQNTGLENKLSSKIFEERTKRVFEFFQKQGPDQFGDFWSVLRLSPGQKLSDKGVSEAMRRHKAYWHNDPVLFALWVDTIAKQGKDRAATDAVKLRFIFEGMGIDLSNWWTDLKQPTYRSNSGFGLPWWEALENLDPVLKKLRSEIEPGHQNNGHAAEASEKRYCAELAGLSRRALQRVQISTTDSSSLQNDSEIRPFDESYPSVFETTCRKCHVDHAVGPAIPFDNRLAFESWLKAGNNAKSLKWRTLEAHETKKMPPTRDLNLHERQQIEKYLKSLTGN